MDEWTLKETNWMFYVSPEGWNQLLQEQYEVIGNQMYVPDDASPGRCAPRERRHLEPATLIYLFSC